MERIILDSTGACIAIVPCELEDSTFAEELEETPGIEDELAGTTEEEEELPEIAEEELCGMLEEELTGASEELDAGTSCFATPAAANSGA